jgi:hypothetical protein
MGGVVEPENALIVRRRERLGFPHAILSFRVRYRPFDRVSEFLRRLHS